MASPGRPRCRSAAPLPRFLPVLLVRGVVLLQAVLPLLFTLPLRAEPAPGGGRAGTIALECRLPPGPWQPCQMTVERVGAHWWLLIGNQRLEFRHDGRGQVTMQRGNENWRQVDSRWGDDASLCWDGVCARGEIPLD